MKLIHGHGSIKLCLPETRWTYRLNITLGRFWLGLSAWHPNDEDYRAVRLGRVIGGQQFAHVRSKRFPS